MKKTAIILSAILAASMAVPNAANAKNNYPTPPRMITFDEYEALSAEEKAERSALIETFESELSRAYQNGEYDWDFNFDGNIDVYDADLILRRYAEFSTGVESNSYIMIFRDPEHGMDIRKHVSLTPEMRAKVDEEGDICNDGIINARDCSYMLKTIFSVKEKGDVNTDGMLDARDASKILEYYSAKSVSSDVNYETEKNMEYLGDLNGDEIIDASDASFALAEYSKRATE